MKKIYSLLLLGGLLFFGAGNAWAHSWSSGAMKIGGITTDCTAWSTDGSNPTDLGTLTDMTITSITFNVSSTNSRSGSNMFFRIWDGGASQVGSDQNLWLGNITYEGGSNYSVSWTGTEDLAAAVGLTLEPGKTYYIDMWAKTYGGTPDNIDEWYSGTNSSNYHAKFVYLPNTATIGAKGWTTFCRTYPLDLEHMTASEGTVTAYYASAASLNTVTMTSTTATTHGGEEGEGIMLKGTAGATITIPVATTDGSPISGNLLVGLTSDLVVSNTTTDYGKFYVLVNGSTYAEFQNIQAYIDNSGSTPRTLTIPAGKAYLNLFEVEGFAPSVIRIVDEESGATSYEAIDASEKAVKFIENGKIFILRDGVVYDMMGAIVK